MNFSHMRKVLKDDWKRILTNPVALITIAGMAVIPGLYAWVNIVACWNVYENTGNIPVAIVNNDQPAQFRDQEIFIGADVVEQLKENDKVDWKFVSQEQANLGLADGTYFASIELPEDFSYNFTSMFTENPIKPKIIFKVDNKVNPVAEKITESAKNQLVQEIKSSFISSVNQSVFSKLNLVGQDAEANLENILKMKDALVKLNQNMELISTTLDNLHTNSVNLNQFLTGINATWPFVQNGLEVVGKTTVNQQELSRATQQRLDQSLTYLDANLSYIRTSSDRIHALLTELNQAAKEGSSAKLDSVFFNLDVTLSSISASLEATSSYLSKYLTIEWNLLPNPNPANPSERKAHLSQMIHSLNTIKAEIDSMRTKLSDIHRQSDAAARITAGIADTVNNDLYQTESRLTSILTDYHQNIRAISAPSAANWWPPPTTAPPSPSLPRNLVPSSAICWSPPSPGQP